MTRFIQQLKTISVTNISIQLIFSKRTKVSAVPITYKDVINFKSKKAFPQYSLVLDDKVLVEVTDGLLVTVNDGYV